MTLAQTISEARHRTRSLLETVEAGDSAAVDGILAERAVAMAAFEDAHRAAGPEIVASCREEILALQHEDRQLQEAAAASLVQADQACREALGATSANQSDYRDDPALACVDRRA